MVVSAEATVGSSQYTRSVTPTPGTSTAPSVNPDSGFIGEGSQGSIGEGIIAAPVRHLRTNIVRGSHDTINGGLRAGYF